MHPKSPCCGVTMSFLCCSSETGRRYTCPGCNAGYTVEDGHTHQTSRAIAEPERLGRRNPMTILMPGNVQHTSGYVVGRRSL